MSLHIGIVEDSRARNIADKRNEIKRQKAMRDALGVATGRICIDQYGRVVSYQ